MFPTSARGALKQLSVKRLQQPCFDSWITPAIVEVTNAEFYLHSANYPISTQASPSFLLLKRHG